MKKAIISFLVLLVMMPNIWAYTPNTLMSNLVLSSGMSESELDVLLKNNEETIKSNDNIFIFRTTDNVSMDLMKQTTAKLMELNPILRIFIDQEGGLVNRYNIFDSVYTFKYYLDSDSVLSEKYNILDAQTRKLFETSISGRSTFISAKKIGEIYNTIEDKDNFLDFISYFELYVTKFAGINTFGLDLDLDYGNSAISGNNRAFSKNVQDTIKYGNSFVKNAKLLNISLYLKHYPGMGAGITDTHLGILEYTLNDKEYIEDNFWVFESVMKTSHDIKTNVGFMVGHVVLPKKYESRFLGNLGEVEYVLTDDLGMGAYKNLKGKNFNDKFFTTNDIINDVNVIQVSTTINRIK